MSTRVEPVSAELLVERVADAVLARTGGADTPVRLLVDGHPSTHPELLADALVAPLETAGRRVARVRVADFLRPRSLRLEHGRDDPDSLLDGWIDVEALNREVLRRVVERGEYLPSLRDPDTDRATRAAYVTADPGTVVVLDGALTIARGLDVDVAVHLALKPGTLRRRTPDEQAWELPAYERYAAQAERAADLLVRVDHPDHPALVHR
ncbi:uridine kinase [Promicromonospora kroppenstedtii]|uniref:uridine kinase n=1 Tax=Promicromonospora kroppenstedtii TaxID=440482 RepID=UPI00056971A3|nr:uridine kinase [Promicromonospora kroppenstedtii]